MNRKVTYREFWYTALAAIGIVACEVTTLPENAPSEDQINQTLDLARLEVRVEIESEVQATQEHPMWVTFNTLLDDDNDSTAAKESIAEILSNEQYQFTQSVGGFSKIVLGFETSRTTIDQDLSNDGAVYMSSCQAPQVQTFARTSSSIVLRYRLPCTAQAVDPKGRIRARLRAAAESALVVPYDPHRSRQMPGSACFLPGPADSAQDAKLWSPHRSECAALGYSRQQNMHPMLMRVSIENPMPPLVYPEYDRLAQAVAAKGFLEIGFLITPYARPVQPSDYSYTRSSMVRDWLQQNGLIRRRSERTGVLGRLDEYVGKLFGTSVVVRLLDSSYFVEYREQSVVSQLAESSDILIYQGHGGDVETNEFLRTTLSPRYRIYISGGCSSNAFDASYFANASGRIEENYDTIGSDYTQRTSPGYTTLIGGKEYALASQYILERLLQSVAWHGTPREVVVASWNSILLVTGVANSYAYRASSLGTQFFHLSASGVASNRYRPR